MQNVGFKLERLEIIIVLKSSNFLQSFVIFGSYLYSNFLAYFSRRNVFLDLIALLIYLPTVSFTHRLGDDGEWFG